MSRAGKAAAFKNDADPFSHQWLPVLEAKWRWVDAEYQPQELWGKDGASFLLWHAALCCHGDLPLGCNALALAITSSNGARTKLFGGKLKNLWAWFINENYPQTRKSETTGFLRAGAKQLDDLIRDDVAQQFQKAISERIRREREAGLLESANALKHNPTLAPVGDHRNPELHST